LVRATQGSNLRSPALDGSTINITSPMRSGQDEMMVEVK
jgi:hypothetical protein